jgi:hypothetical protein
MPKQAPKKGRRTAKAAAKPASKAAARSAAKAPASQHPQSGRPHRPATVHPLRKPEAASRMPERSSASTDASAGSVAATDPRLRPHGKYVYCIIQSSDPLQFGAAGIGDEPAEVYTVNYRDLAAVVSDAPIGMLDSTRDNVLAHERVNEMVMREYTVIPMSFGTIFKTREDTVELLRSAYDAFGDVLSKMQNKLEFGLKVIWEREPIIREIEEDDEDIRRLKDEIASQKGSTYFARMQYGRAMDHALQARSERYVSEILERLRDVSVASRINRPIGDKMIMNAAFLISRDQETAFDMRVKAIATEHDKLTFKYTGPWPPYNFVNIRLKLERV